MYHNSFFFFQIKRIHKDLDLLIVLSLFEVIENIFANISPLRKNYEKPCLYVWEI